MTIVVAKDSQTVCVYCASSSRVDACYLDAARQLGSLCAARGVKIVCGAGRSGLMGALIDGSISNGGEAIGVIPRFMVDKGWHHKQLTRMEITDTMHSRKELMARMSCAVIAMPGGCGTIEELMEIITWRQLGLYDGNIVILNTAGYYDPLLKMLSQAVDQGFMKSNHSCLWSVATTPSQAVDMALASVGCVAIEDKY